MASKTSKEAAAAPAASTTDTAQSTKPQLVPLPCALEFFPMYCETAWGYCREYLTLFFDESDRFTEDFIVDQLKLVEQVKAMPNAEARIAAASLARESLIARRQAVGSLAKRLSTAIDYAFKDPRLVEVELKAAGFESFGTPSQENWASVSDFISNANNYLTANATKLVERKAIKDTFAKKFEDTGKDFNTVWSDFITKEKAATDGTQAVNEVLKAILTELSPMLEIGKLIFEFDANNRKKFTTTDLVKQVSGTSPARIFGVVKLVDKPRAGVRVAIVGMPDKWAITSKSGGYEIPIAEGSYSVEFTSPDTQPLIVENVKLTAGKGKRLSVVLQPVPVAVAIVPETPQPAAPSTNAGQELADAVSSVMNGMTNGAAV